MTKKNSTPPTRHPPDIAALAEAEQRYHTLVDSGQALIWTSGLDGKCDYFNLPWLRFTGRTLEQELGDGWVEGVHPDDRKKCLEVYSGAFERRERFSLEYRLRRHDGSFGWILDDGTPRFDGQGSFLGFVGHCLDITDRKQAEEKIRALLAEVQKEKTVLSTLINSIADEVWFADAQGKFTLVNPAASKEFGLGPDQTIEIAELAKGLEVFRPDGSPRPIEEAPPLQALRGNAVRNQEEIVRTPSHSELRHRQVSASPVKDPQGRILGTVSIVRDITELKRVENALRWSEAQLHSTLEATADGILAVDGNGKVIKANHRFAELWRIPAPLMEAGDDHALLDFVMDQLSDPDAFINKVQALYQTDAKDMDRLAFKDGRLFERYSFPMIMEGAIIGRVWSFRDITGRKRAEAALQSSEARYRLLVENAQEAIIVAQDGLLKFTNQAASRITGYSGRELLSRPFSDFIHPDDRDMVVDRHQKRLVGIADPSRYAFRLLTRTGEVRWVEIGAVQIDWEDRPATLNFLVDITDRRKAEAVVQAALREKEALLREIHHRVKNNMQIISSLMNLQAESVADGNSRRILKEGLLRIRSMSIVHEKLYKSQDLSRIDFAEYAQSLTDHLFYFFEVKTGQIRLEKDLEPVFLDIESAVPCALLLNELLTNALKHAFPAGRKGVLEIGLRRQADGTVALRVADDGVGLPGSADLTQTSGIGLQITALLVDQLDGTIAIDREKGAAFTIVFREPESN